MKKNRSVKFLALLFALVMAFGLSACSSAPSSGSGGGASAGDNSGPEANKDPVTLKMIEHSNQGTNDGIKALNAALHEQHPYITVESTITGPDQYPQLLQTRIAAGDVDIFELSCFNITNPDWAKGQDPNTSAQYIDNGDVMELTDQPFIKNWDPTAVADADTYNGKIYSLNIGKVAMNGLFYNKQIFDDNGLKVPETWDEFVTLCDTLQSKGIAPLTGGGKDGWPIGMMWNGFVNTFEPDPAKFAQQLWTGERKFNDPQTVKLFEKMAKFASYYEKGVTSVDYASVIGRFVAGKAAMLPDGTWQGAQITTADPNFKFGYFCIPGDTKAEKPVQLAGKYDIGYAGYAKTKHADEVLAWLEFLSQKDVYTNLTNSNGFIPTMQGVTLSNEFMNSLAPLNESFQRNFENLYRAPKGIGKYGGFAIAQLQVLGGDVDTPEKLADLAQTDWDTAMAAIK